VIEKWIHPGLMYPKRRFGRTKTMVKVHTVGHNVRLIIPLAACLAFALFGQTAQADLSTSYYDPVTGRNVAAQVSIVADTLTVDLQNLATSQTADPTLALGGFYFDLVGVTATTALTPMEATGHLFNFSTKQDLGTAPKNLWPGWGFGLRSDTSFNFGVASTGNSSAVDPIFSFNQPFLPDTPPPHPQNYELDGPAYMIVSATGGVAGAFLAAKQNPVVLGSAHFEFSGATGLTLGDSGVFTFGTAPEFVTPLPGAVLLGFMGLGVAGWRLRRFV
jgi:hypothetical protein